MRIHKSRVNATLSEGNKNEQTKENMLPCLGLTEQAKIKTERKKYTQNYDWLIHFNTFYPLLYNTYYPLLYDICLDNIS